MATLLTTRCQITATVAQGHAAIESIKCACTLESNGSNRPCNCDIPVEGTPEAEALAALLLSEIKAAVVVPAGATLSLDSYEGELWVADGHAAIESDVASGGAWAKPWVDHPADGSVAAWKDKPAPMMFEPSAQLQTDLLAACLAVMPS